jgi:hypothetical protein
VEQNRAPLVQLYLDDPISSTTTSTGLKVYARLDTDTYPTKIKITDEQIKAVQITGDEFHPEWNYRTIPSVILE